VVLVVQRLEDCALSIHGFCLFDSRFSALTLLLSLGRLFDVLGQSLLLHLGLLLLDLA
jgi:hypothetical protein